MGLRWLQATPVSHTLPEKSEVKPNLLTENETRQRLAPSFSLGEKQTSWIQVWRDHLPWQNVEGPLPRWELTCEPGSQAAKRPLSPPLPPAAPPAPGDRVAFQATHEGFPDEAFFCMTKPYSWPVPDRNKCDVSSGGKPKGTSIPSGPTPRPGHSSPRPKPVTAGGMPGEVPLPYSFPHSPVTVPEIATGTFILWG